MPLQIHAHTYPRTCKRLGNNHSRAQKISNALTSSMHRAMHRHTQVVAGAKRFFPTDAQESAPRCGPAHVTRRRALPPMTGWEKYARGGSRLSCSYGRRDGPELRGCRPVWTWPAALRVSVCAVCPVRTPRHPPAGMESAGGEGGYAVLARVGGGGREGTANTPSLQAGQPYELQHELTFIERLPCARLCAQRFYH